MRLEALAKPKRLIELLETFIHLSLLPMVKEKGST